MEMFWVWGGIGGAVFDLLEVRGGEAFELRNLTTPICMGAGKDHEGREEEEGILDAGFWIDKIRGGQEAHRVVVGVRLAGAGG